MISSIAMARAQWLALAVAFALRHVIGREQLASHLDTLARDRADSYFAGLADGVRLAHLATVQTAPKAHWN